MDKKFQIIKNLLLFVNIIGLGAISYFTWIKVSSVQEEAMPKALVKEFFDNWEEKKGLSLKTAPVKILKQKSLPLEVFVANLAQVDEQSYHITFYPVLTFAPDSEVSEENFTSHLPKMRDRIIELVNTKTKDELLKLGGKEKFKDELKMSLNSLNLPYQVNRVFFTGLLVK